MVVREIRYGLEISAEVTINSMKLDDKQGEFE